MVAKTNGENTQNVEQPKTRPEDKLPPELSKCRKKLLFIAIIVMVSAVGFITYFCFFLFWNPKVIPECICWPYLSLFAFLVGLVTYFYLRYPLRMHNKRKEDRSKVEALIQEAIRVEKKNRDKEKIEKLEKEVDRLRNEVGPKGWTEYQILPLDSMLIDFLNDEELKARAQLRLDILKEFADGDAFSYNSELYREWEGKIKSNIESLNKGNDNGDENGNGDKNKIARDALRANLRAILEHIADYQSRWAEGTTIVSGIRICGATAIVVFILMGIIPLIYPYQWDPNLGVLSWGFLGAAGAIATALIGLWKAREVEVADTSGQKELSSIILGAPLGLLAGVLIFAAIAGGIIESGGIVPDLDRNDVKDVYRSIAWAVVAGMGFEGIIQGLRKKVEPSG